jgi:hypothetical protein
MKKTKLAFLTTCLFLMASSFVLVNDWVLVEAVDFSIEFPAAPTEEEQSLESAIGPLKLYIRMYEVLDVEKDENFAYGMITTEYPVGTIHSDSTQTLEKVFDGAINGCVENVKGKLLSQQVVEINGFPGREFRIDFQDGLATFKMKAFLVKNKMFILQTITDPKKEGNKSAERFLGSFKLK